MERKACYESFMIDARIRNLAPKTMRWYVQCPNLN